MSISINSVTLVGNLTRDPDTFSAGCELGIAVNDRVKNGDDWENRASFFQVVVFGKQADACVKFLSKGSPVAVQGKLSQDRWQNDAGENRSKVKIIAFAVQFLGSKDDREPVATGGGTSDPDDIPFARPPFPDGERTTWGRPQWRGL